MSESLVLRSRFRFSSRLQREDESVEDFIQDLKVLARSCDFSDPDDRVRDQIILGVGQEGLREKCLETDSSLEDVIRMCRAQESHRWTLERFRDPRVKLSRTNNQQVVFHANVQVNVLSFLAQDLLPGLMEIVKRIIRALLKQGREKDSMAY